MKLKYFFVAALFTAAVACNNDASTADSQDTTTADTNQSIYPEPDDVLGNDTVPSPEQSKNPTLENK